MSATEPEGPETYDGNDSDEGSVTMEFINSFYNSGQSAAEMAAPLLAPPGVLPLPVLHLRRPDRKHQARFPFVLGGFDDDIISVDWTSCNAQNICDILTCKMFGSGKGAQKSMGVWARELMKFLKSKCSAVPALTSRIDAVLESSRSALSSDDFEHLLQDILRQAAYLPPARSFLEKYGKNHVIHVVSKSFFPQVTDVQVAECRCGATAAIIQLVFHA